jgi:GT2 family glycosyltransferase
MKIAKESLSAIKSFTHKNYELIIIDNNSTDGSMQHILRHLDSIELDAKVLMSKHNLGFTGGTNLGYKYMNPHAKYIVLINSDLVPSKDSLYGLVSHMESDDTLGALQGIIMKYDMTGVDSCGVYLDEAIRSYADICVTTIRDVTYADGSYCILRVSALRQIQGNYIFDDELFAYLEDALLGIKLWNNSYKVRSIPIFVGKHLRSGSGGHSFKFLLVKNKTALNMVITTRFGQIYFVRIFIIGLLRSLLRAQDIPPLPSFIRAFSQGLMVGSRLRTKGLQLNLYKAPYVRLKTSETLLLPKRRIRVSAARIGFDEDRTITYNRMMRN